jgi:hypothetical protein
LRESDDGDFVSAVMHRTCDSSSSATPSVQSCVGSWTLALAQLRPRGTFAKEKRGLQALALARLRLRGCLKCGMRTRDDLARMYCSLFSREEYPPLLPANGN